MDLEKFIEGKEDEVQALRSSFHPEYWQVIMLEFADVYSKRNVNNVVLDDVKVEFPIKKVEVNFDGDLLAEIEIKNNTLKVLRAVNGGGYKVNCEKVSITEK